METIKGIELNKLYNDGFAIHPPLKFNNSVGNILSDLINLAKFLFL